MPNARVNESPELSDSRFDKVYTLLIGHINLTIEFVKSWNIFVTHF